MGIFGNGKDRSYTVKNVLFRRRSGSKWMEGVCRSLRFDEIKSCDIAACGMPAKIFSI